MLSYRVQLASAPAMLDGVICLLLGLTSPTASVSCLVAWVYSTVFGEADLLIPPSVRIVFGHILQSNVFSWKQPF